MRKILGITIALIVLLVIAYPAAAIAVNANEAAGDHRPTIIVEEGKGKEAGLIKVTHIHYAKSVDKVKPSKTTTCYKLAGWKWSLPVQYKLKDVASQPGLSVPVRSATIEWDDATSAWLFSTPVSTTTGTWGTYDNVNLVTYGDYSTDGVIAVTLTWYSRLTKKAVESDIMFDTDFTWGDATKVTGVMDVENIATHEIGHTLGLSDLYTSSCTPVTMYGYSWYGDIEKRDLAQPDITGIQKLYGI